MGIGLVIGQKNSLHRTAVGMVVKIQIGADALLHPTELTEAIKGELGHAAPPRGAKCARELT